MTTQPTFSSQNVLTSKIFGSSMASSSADAHSHAPALLRIWSARDNLKTLLSQDQTSADKLPNAREELAEAIQLQLVQCGANDAVETEVNAIDCALSPHAADLKGGLLKALRVCACSAPSAYLRGCRCSPSRRVAPPPRAPR